MKVAGILADESRRREKSILAGAKRRRPAGDRRAVASIRARPRAAPLARGRGRRGVAAIAETGFLAVADVFSVDEVEAYKQALSDVIAAGDPKMVEFEAAARDRTLAPQEREAHVLECM